MNADPNPRIPPNPGSSAPGDDWETRWVLGGLTEQERARAEERLKADPALHAELAAQRAALYTLLGDLDRNPAPVPVGAEDRLMARLRAEERADPVPVSPQARRRPWTWALLGAAAVALLAALLNLPHAPTEPAVAYGDRPGAVSLPLRAGAGEGAPLGTVVRLPDGEVYVQLDQAAPPGQVYQLWALRGEEVVSLGTFEQALALRVAAQPGLSLAVSVEPPGGSPLPTSDPIAVLPL